MPRTLNTLIVEDNPSDAVLIERVLSRSGFDVQARRVATTADTFEALRSAPWDVVLADSVLPGTGPGVDRGTCPDVRCEWVNPELRIWKRRRGRGGHHSR